MTTSDKKLLHIIYNSQMCIICLDLKGAGIE